jgi:hypothetical protein
VAREANHCTRHRQQATTNPTVQKTGQSVQAPTVNSDSLEMYRALSVVEQNMAELKGAASEEDKFLSVAKILFKLMKQNGTEFIGPSKS